MHIRYKAVLSKIYTIIRRLLDSSKVHTFTQRGGMGIVACIVSFQILALIIMPIMVYCYQVMLYDNTLDQLEYATEIVSFEMLGNVTARRYSAQSSYENDDVTELFKEGLLNELGDGFSKNDFRNISAKLSVNSLEINYDYNYKEDFLQKDKWLLCKITYTMPINN